MPQPAAYHKARLAPLTQISPHTWKMWRMRAPPASSLTGMCSLRPSSMALQGRGRAMAVLEVTELGGRHPNLICRASTASVPAQPQPNAPEPAGIRIQNREQQASARRRGAAGWRIAVHGQFAAAGGNGVLCVGGWWERCAVFSAGGTEIGVHTSSASKAGHAVHRWAIPTPALQAHALSPLLLRSESGR